MTKNDNPKPPPRDELTLCTADMPTDYIATNGYEYVLKSYATELEEKLRRTEDQNQRLRVDSKLNDLIECREKLAAAEKEREELIRDMEELRDEAMWLRAENSNLIEVKDAAEKERDENWTRALQYGDALEICRAENAELKRQLEESVTKQKTTYDTAAFVIGKLE